MTSEPPDLGTSSGSAAQTGFWIWSLVLAAASLWPIWANRLLPMQDYPQHLFIAEVLRSFDNPAFDWALHYELNPAPGSYSLAYAVLGAVGRVTGMEVAGKILVSLYVLAMASLVVRARSEYPSHVPWPLLLIFPMVFNQTYFYGFLSYLLSIPLLLFSLLSYETWVRRPGSRAGLVAMSTLLVLLFLTHPYSVMVFLIWSLLLAAFRATGGTRWRRAIAPPALLAAVFASWAWLGANRVASADHPWGIAWSSPWEILSFFGLSFTGMRLTGGVDLVAVGVWSALALLLMAGSTRRAPSRLARVFGPVLLVTAAGYLTLPFWFGHYSYFNLRLAPVLCIVGVLWLGSIRMPAWKGHACAALALALVLNANHTQALLSRETGELLPLLGAMERNAAVLPVLSDTGTAILDPAFFYQLHSHDHFYYHVLVGGGVSPELFPSPLLPLRFRPGFSPPSPDPGRGLGWGEALRAYRYVLVRGDAPTSDFVGRFAKFRERSGKWALFENPDFDASRPGPSEPAETQ